MPDSWWDKALDRFAPQPSGLPRKAVRWEQPLPMETPDSMQQARMQARMKSAGRDPFADTPPGTAVAITYEQALAGQSDGYQPARGKVKSLLDESVPGSCPECGSPNFFSRRNVMLRGPAPAPHCSDCGYKGDAMYYQEAGPAQPGQTMQVTRQFDMESHVDFQHPFAYIK